MALRQINMIPGNILARAALARHLLFWGKGLVVIILLFSMFYIAQVNQFSRQKKVMHSDDSIKVKIVNKIGQAEKESNEINILMQDLKLKGGLLATLTSQQSYYDILAVFAATFNDATWINHLSIERGNKEDKDSSNLMVDGFSKTHNSLGVFLESLSANSRIKDLVLVYAKKQEQKSMDKDLSNLIRFQLTCSIIGESS